MPPINRVFRGGGKRPRPRPSPSGGQLLTASDFTYLGAYKVPASVALSTTQEPYFGYGLALRRETADATNNVHLLATCFGGTVNHEVFEWRDATPEIHSTTLSAYPTATVLKTYGDIYSGKKRIIYNGDDIEMVGQLDGDFGLYWDATSERLYWSYGFGYSTDDNSWCLGYSTLNYAGETGTGHGPWRLYNGGSGQSWKSLSAGLMGIPSAYAASHLGGKRLAVGMGGYYSQVASCDASIGPSLTAIDAVSASEEADLASTPLVGYWPYNANPGAGRGRCNRPEPMTAQGFGEGWGLDKFSWNDRVRAGVWIDNGVKRGVVFFGHYGRGRSQYLSSQVPSERSGHYWAIYDPNDFTPVSGTPRYDVQPRSIYDYQYPTIDYSQVFYAGGPAKSVSGITSSAAPIAGDTNCTVTCTGHGFADGNYVAIEGASRAEYNELWEIPPTGGVINANSFYIRNTSHGTNWSGISPTGTITAKKIQYFYDQPKGAAFDPATNKLYVGVAIAGGASGNLLVVHVYQVAL